MISIWNFDSQTGMSINFSMGTNGIEKAASKGEKCINKLDKMKSDSNKKDETKISLIGKVILEKVS